ncbi:gamma-secretase subunit APH-1A-like isoform X3 [Polyodon spathula]|uniref:gamma-secretase subunit APH-1A-like isoform X3 n=1 Tax=Polyodon spathula TaxID=7913 RepID=UPI001B7DFD2D|nr:gamma-secretase subunit APH-1A-like isoform X3 [Polyodon spathula]
MGLPVFLGCSCIAFGPAFALFILTVAADPLRVIILVAGSFFWLVSVLLGSLVWFVGVQLSDQGNPSLQSGLLVFGVALSVLLQEAFRFANYKLLKKADRGLASLSENGRSPISLQQMAYAFLTMALVLLHTFWGVIFFDACERGKWLAGIAVVVSHLVTSGLTFLCPWYETSLVPIYLLTAAMAAWAFSTAGGSVSTLQRCFTCECPDMGQGYRGEVFLLSSPDRLSKARQTEN